MIKQHSQLMHLCLGACDLLTVGAAWWSAYALRFCCFDYSDVPHTRQVLTNMFIAMLITLVVMLGMGLYKPKRDKSFLLEIGQLLRGSALAWLVTIGAMMYTNESFFTRLMLLLYLPLLMACLLVERGLFRSCLRYIRRRGWNLRHAVIVGTGRLAQSTLHKLQTNSWTGIRVAGFIETSAEHPRSHVRGIPVIGTTDEVRAIVEQRGVDCVFVALPSQQGETVRRVISQLEQTPADVRIIPDLFLSRFPNNVAVSELDGLPILSLRENPLAGWPAIYKRIFDIGGALFGLALFGLPMLIIAVLIRLGDGGPIIYTQRRISYGGRPFDLYKFRTMRGDAEHAGPEFATRNDPRCTRVGRTLRSTSLDELPQLFNVLRGDMSLVGPRPERPEMLEKIRSELPHFPTRLKVRAGLTGWAQINGFRGRTSFRKRLQYDLYYLNHWSPMFDLRIVVATLFRGFRHPNAY